MFKFVILALLIAYVSADIDATVTRFGSQVNIDGSYAYDVAQSNGAEWQESGIGGEFAKGSFQFYTPEGEFAQVSYTADEQGFHPVSNLLPTPPPIPDYILRAIEYIRAHPTQEELADREVRARQF